MTTDGEINRLISSYLRDYANARKRSDRVPPPGLIKRLRKHPEATFVVVSKGA
jgi:hypothetical protein